MENKISELDEQLDRYLAMSISKRKKQDYVLVNRQIIECINKVDEYQKLVDKPIEDCDTTRKFSQLCDSIECMMKVDLAHVSMHDKINMYMNIVRALKKCASFKQKSRIALIEV